MKIRIVPDVADRLTKRQKKTERQTAGKT